MPSVKNPNKPSQNRLAARAAKSRKVQQKRSAAGQSRIEKSDTKRGARPGILPSSGPRAVLSSKKRRKLERKMGYALKRKEEATGEVTMIGELPTARLELRRRSAHLSGLTCFVRITRRTRLGR